MVKKARVWWIWFLAEPEILVFKFPGVDIDLEF